ISSIDMKMTSGSRRMITPTTPIVKITADTARYQDSETMITGSPRPTQRRFASGCGFYDGLRLAEPSFRPTTRQEHHADHRGQQQGRRDLARKQIGGEPPGRRGSHAATRPRRTG